MCKRQFSKSTGTPGIALNAFRVCYLLHVCFSPFKVTDAQCERSQCAETVLIGERERAINPIVQCAVANCHSVITSMDRNTIL